MIEFTAPPYVDSRGAILFRRFMARTAERLCRDTGALALVTGDSLGQVASQTLENMVSNSRAVDLPILRPLVGMDKQDIIDLARRIGTYEDSIKPYKDCCALIERQPRTRSRHERLEDFEREHLADYDRLIETTLADGLSLHFQCGQRIDASRPDPLLQPVRRNRQRKARD
jgi:tRNA uracil 4-sulfurtransferase